MDANTHFDNFKTYLSEISIFSISVSIFSKDTIFSKASKYMSNIFY